MTATSTIDEEERPSPSMYIDKTATVPTACTATASEDSDGPLLCSTAAPRKNKMLHTPRGFLQTSPMLLHQDSWHKSCNPNNTYSNGKQNNACIWTLTCILAFIAFCNLLLNLTILAVLRISQGMESLEVIPEQDLIKFYGNTDLDKVCLHRGICEGFGDEPVELIGNSGGVEIQVANKLQGWAPSTLQIQKNGTTVTKIESLKIKDPRSGLPIFSTDFPNFSLPQGVEKIEVDISQTHRVIAPKTKDLTLTSDESIFLYGAEGATVDSKEIIWTSKDDLFLHSKTGDIIMDAHDGIKIPNLPIATAHSYNQSSKVQNQYKVCICMPTGKIFLSSLHRGLSKINCAVLRQMMQRDPCAV